MPMNKLNVLFKMSYIFSSQIFPVVPQIHKMYDIDLKGTSSAKYDFFIKNYYSSNNNILIITEVKSPHSDISGFFCIYFNRVTNTYIKSLYCFSKDFTNTDKIFHQLNFITSLGQNNILYIQIASMLLNNASQSQYGIVVEKNFQNVGDMSLKIENRFIELVLLNKRKTISLSCQLLHGLTNKSASRIMHALENKDYILAFFDRDYSKIINFLEKFILILQEVNELLQYRLSIFFTNFMKNNLNTFWKNELMRSDEDFEYFKDIHLSNCFFEDLRNLFCLVEDPNYKFRHFDYDQYIGALFGYPLIAVLFNFQEDIDEKNLECFAFDRKKNKLDFKLMIDSTKRKIFFMFNGNNLKKSNITQIDCIVKTPNKLYKSSDIDLIEYL
ncbi:hypothetical protein AAJ76_460006783 [Vairimorpha ceranae]|uniref:Uncharacterized protein n=1 Tax=Vairimorpha ceranae TaxID=40302 RepID=A0A0F9ZAB6_9MICR|nr:hypothetical protein AAJ76_460006783 [Vairimorpha ceranae]KKO74764.1 hypothetical protein AAJ76_460006783 [Vairimorpha ceranae]